MNPCFRKLGIMNLCTSARESWITRLLEKLNKIHVWINCVRSRECGIIGVSESPIFKNFSGGACPGPHYIIRAFGADSPLVSPVTLVPNVHTLCSVTKKKIENRSLNTKKTIQNETMLPLKKSIGDQKSSWIMNLEENFSKNHESLRQKRQESWISRFKWFRFIPRYYSFHCS